MVDCRRWRTAPGSSLLHWALAVVFSGLLLAGCGTPAAPQPPTLNLPEPVRNLQAQRTADTVVLTWTMPARTTDKAPLKGPVRAAICRKQGIAGPCEPVATQPFAIGQNVSFADVLPTSLTTERPQLLTYFVALENRHGRSAGVSNAAYSGAGPALPRLADFHTEVRASGVLLLWQPAPEKAEVRIERLEQQTAAPASLTRPVKPTSKTAASAPAMQTLIVRPKGQEGQPFDRALDPGASFGASYQYRAQRIAEVELDGKPVTLRSAMSDAVAVTVRDVFPPAVPAGLVSAPDTRDHAIDLSWTPDTEADLAGYVVYRRTANEGSSTRISDPKKPPAAPFYRDSTAEPGKRYFYSVAAVDQSGNESRKSSEVEDGLPQ